MDFIYSNGESRFGAKKENIKKLFEKKKADLKERLDKSDNDDEIKK